MEVVVGSCVRGYHIYQEIWTPVIGEHLNCKRERDNTEDRYAVAVCKAEDVVVGHVPRTISCLCSAFIRRGGVIDCIVEGARRFSAAYFPTFAFCSDVATIYGARAFPHFSVNSALTSLFASSIDVEGTASLNGP